MKLFNILFIAGLSLMNACSSSYYWSGNKYTPEMYKADQEERDARYQRDLARLDQIEDPYERQAAKERQWQLIMANEQAQMNIYSNYTNNMAEIERQGTLNAFQAAANMGRTIGTRNSERYGISAEQRRPVINIYQRPYGQ